MKYYSIQAKKIWLATVVGKIIILLWIATICTIIEAKNWLLVDIYIVLPMNKGNVSSEAILFKYKH